MPFRALRGFNPSPVLIPSEAETARRNALPGIEGIQPAHGPLVMPAIDLCRNALPGIEGIQPGGGSERAEVIVPTS